MAQASTASLLSEEELQAALGEIATGAIAQPAPNAVPQDVAPIEPVEADGPPSPSESDAPAAPEAVSTAVQSPTWWQRLASVAGQIFDVLNWPLRFLPASVPRVLGPIAWVTIVLAVAASAVLPNVFKQPNPEEFARDKRLALEARLAAQAAPEAQTAEGAPQASH